MPVYNTFHFSFFASLPTNFDEADAYLSNFLIVLTLLFGVSVSLLASFDHDELTMMDKLYQGADLCMHRVGNFGIESGLTPFISRLPPPLPPLLPFHTRSTL